ncbi:hypothetical protein EDB85DRAFT_1307038 [Lactarius pseudohatsudake]|nr:hypothetical protein EDB85DRAFT_1307038 [Lactarius pseudohatsudake]
MILLHSDYKSTETRGAHTVLTTAALPQSEIVKKPSFYVSIHDFFLLWLFSKSASVQVFIIVTNCQFRPWLGSCVPCATLSPRSPLDTAKFTFAPSLLSLSIFFPSWLGVRLGRRRTGGSRPKCQ